MVQGSWCSLQAVQVSWCTVLLVAHISTHHQAGMPLKMCPSMHLHALSVMLHDPLCHMHSAFRYTALIWAAEEGDGAAVAALLKVEGIDVNAKDKYG